MTTTNKINKRNARKKCIQTLRIKGISIINQRRQNESSLARLARERWDNSVCCVRNAIWGRVQSVHKWISPGAEPLNLQSNQFLHSIFNETVCMRNAYGQRVEWTIYCTYRHDLKEKQKMWIYKRKNLSTLHLKQQKTIDSDTKNCAFVGQFESVLWRFFLFAISEISLSRRWYYDGAALWRALSHIAKRIRQRCGISIILMSLLLGLGWWISREIFPIFHHRRNVFSIFIGDIIISAR